MVYLNGTVRQSNKRQTAKVHDKYESLEGSTHTDKRKGIYVYPWLIHVEV